MARNPRHVVAPHYLEAAQLRRVHDDGVGTKEVRHLLFRDVRCVVVGARATLGLLAAREEGLVDLSGPPRVHGERDRSRLCQGTGKSQPSQLGSRAATAVRGGGKCASVLSEIILWLVRDDFSLPDCDILD